MSQYTHVKRFLLGGGFYRSVTARAEAFAVKDTNRRASNYRRSHQSRYITSLVNFQSSIDGFTAKRVST